MNAKTIAIDDSCLTRVGIEQVIGRDPRLRVVATAATAAELDQLDVRPDLVIWDQASCPDANPVQVTDELRNLLRVADVPAPYLLVDHSLGGLYARHYARRSKASGGSTRRWPNQSHAARSASSTTPDTSPSTCAVPTPCSRQSRTYSAGDLGPLPS